MEDFLDTFWNSNSYNRIETFNIYEYSEIIQISNTQERKISRETDKKNYR